MLFINTVNKKISHHKNAKNSRVNPQNPMIGMEPLTTLNTKAPRGNGIKPILRDIRSEWSANAYQEK